MEQEQHQFPHNMKANNPRASKIRGFDQTPEQADLTGLTSSNKGGGGGEFTSTANVSQHSLQSGDVKLTRSHDNLLLLVKPASWSFPGI